MDSLPFPYMLPHVSRILVSGERETLQEKE